jgi:hypothetical protein
MVGFACEGALAHDVGLKVIQGMTLEGVFTQWQNDTKLIEAQPAHARKDYMRMDLKRYLSDGTTKMRPM